MSSTPITTCSPHSPMNVAGAYRRGLAADRTMASAGVPHLRRNINRRHPHYVRGSLGKTVGIGRVGPAGE
jgi:hypothetical protein